MKRHKNHLKLACLLMASPVILACLAGFTPAHAAGLIPDDCIKCHAQAPKDIAASGMAHRTEVTCVECHEGHPPISGEEIIPSCNRCHEGTEHYKLTNCSSCHTNPHTPLVISIDSNITTECLTCHTDQMAQLQQYESKHTQVSCSTCHRSQHKMIPDCVHCHAPHSKDMVQKDCLTCHKPHMPKQVNYPVNTPSSSCASCHGDVLTQLQNNPAQHAKLTCATCHKDTHKMIPQCSSCHGEPHPAVMHQNFPKCGQCHGIAHDLNK